MRAHHRAARLLHVEHSREHVHPTGEADVPGLLGCADDLDRFAEGQILGDVERLQVGDEAEIQDGSAQ